MFDLSNPSIPGNPAFTKYLADLIASAGGLGGSAGLGDSSDPTELASHMDPITGILTPNKPKHKPINANNAIRTNVTFADDVLAKSNKPFSQMQGAQGNYLSQRGY